MTSPTAPALPTVALYAAASFGAGVFYAFNNFTLPLYLSALGLPLLVISLLSNTRSLEGSLVQPIVGALSDRTWLGPLGRRRPYILGGIVLAALGFAATANAPALLGTIVGIFAFTLCFNAAIDPYRALLADIAPPEQRDLYQGAATLAEMVGQWAVLVAGFLLWTHGIPPWAFYVAGGAMLVPFLLPVVGLREPPPELFVEERRHRAEAAGARPPLRAYLAELLGRREALKFCVMQALFWFGINAVLPLVSIYVARELGATTGEAQLLPAVLLITVTVFALPVSLLAQRIGRKPTLMLGLGFLVVAGVLGTVVTTKEQGALTFFIAGLGNACMAVCTVPFLADLVPRERLGVFVGIQAAVSSVAGPLASVVAGGLSDLYGTRVIFVLMAVFLALAGLVLHLIQPPPRRVVVA